MIEGAEFKDKLPWLRQVIKLEREKDESLKQYDASILFPLYYGWSIENIQERILKLIEGRAEEFYSYFKFNFSEIGEEIIHSNVKKLCKECKIEKNTTEFYKARKDSPFLNPYCKICDNKKRRFRTRNR